MGIITSAAFIMNTVLSTASVSVCVCMHTSHGLTNSVHQTEFVFKGCCCWVFWGPWPRVLENALSVRLEKVQAVSCRISCYTGLLLNTAFSAGSTGQSGMGTLTFFAQINALRARPAKTRTRKSIYWGTDVI